MTKQSQQLLLMLVIGTLIGVTSVKIFSGDNDTEGRGDATVTTTSGATTTGVETMAPSKESMSSSSQFPLPPSVPENVRVGLAVNNQPAGKTVTVNGLKVESTGWVAVYDDRDGKPGWILGAQKINKGDADTMVELLRPEGTTKGQTYYAAILNDDGDGAFNRLTDLPPLSPEKVIIVKFTAQ